MKTESDNNLLALGLLCFFSPIPSLCITALWYSWILSGFSSYAFTKTVVGEIIGQLPLAITPILCIYGVYQGIKYRSQEEHAGKCILLSIIGLIAYIAILCFIYNIHV